MKKIQIADPIHQAFRLKQELGVKILIIVGGRGSTKSTAAADYVLANVQNGQRWCCAREYLNSVEDSCHALISEEIERIGFSGFTIGNTSISHGSGGQIFHKGISRSPASIKSIVANGIWIEEGETMSQRTIDMLSASFRVTAAQQEKGNKVPDIIITMNRGFRGDPVSTNYLCHAEQDIARQGWYADENMLVVQCNFNQIPKKWFLASGLEPERQRDERLMTPQQYKHKWLGDYGDGIEDGLFDPIWFDHIIDAHKKLGIEPSGRKVGAMDVADLGEDMNAFCGGYGRHVTHLERWSGKDIDLYQSVEKAFSIADSQGISRVKFDGDGLGAGVRGDARKINQNRAQFSKIEFQPFRGSYAGKNLYRPDAFISKHTQIKNRDYYQNLKAQGWYALRDAVRETYRAVTISGYEYSEEDLLFMPSDLPHLDQLLSELCQVSAIEGKSGKMAINKAPEGFASPDLADSLMIFNAPLPGVSGFYSG